DLRPRSRRVFRMPPSTRRVAWIGLLALAAGSMSCGARTALELPGSGDQAEEAPRDCADATSSADHPGATALAIAPDAAGAWFVAGCFEGKIDLGGGHVLHSVRHTHFLARIDATGT